MTLTPFLIELYKRKHAKSVPDFWIKHSFATYSTIKWEKAALKQNSLLYFCFSYKLLLFN